MSLPIQPVSAATQIAVQSPARVAAPSQPGAFQSLLSTAINTVESARAQADTRVQNLLNGGNEELHQVILDTQKAELSLELFQQMRNKVVSAYQEVMRMQM